MNNKNYERESNKEVTYVPIPESELNEDEKKKIATKKKIYAIIAILGGMLIAIGMYVFLLNGIYSIQASSFVLNSTFIFSIIIFICGWAIATPAYSRFFRLGKRRVVKSNDVADISQVINEVAKTLNESKDEIVHKEIVCEYCGSRNDAKDKKCQSCGAFLKFETKK